MTDCETSTQSIISTKTSKAISETRTENDFLQSVCNQETAFTHAHNQETKEGCRKQARIISKSSPVYEKAKSYSSSERVTYDTSRCNVLNDLFTEGNEIDLLPKANVGFTKGCCVLLKRCDDDASIDTVVPEKTITMNVESKSRIEKSKKNDKSPKVGKKSSDIINISKSSINQTPSRKITKLSSCASFKRMKFDDDLEITEIIPTDPLAPDPPSTNAVKGNKKSCKAASSKNNTIVVQNTDQLFQIANGKGIKRKKEPTLVIIDTNSILSGKGPVPVSQVSLVGPISQPSLISGYSDLPAVNDTWNSSGTSVQTSLQTVNHNTSVLSKTSQYICPQISQLNLNDICLIEAPSFIVPYLFSQPPKESLKKYTEMLLKKSNVHTCMEDDSKDISKYKNKLRATEKNEQLKNMWDENDEKFIGKEKLANGTQKNLTESEVTTNEDANEKNDESNLIQDKFNAQNTEHSKRGSLLKEREIADNGSEKCDQDYFKSPLGIFFLEIGSNLVKEYIHNDLTKSTKGIHPKPIEFHSKNLGINLEYNVNDNKSFHFELKKCAHCNFQSESSLVMAHHLEIPHECNNGYKCNFCNMVIENRSLVVYHVLKNHNRLVFLEKSPARHQCHLCIFEDNQKSRVTSHMVACTKRYKPDRNQEPLPSWEPPAKIMHVSRNPSSKRGKVDSSYQMSSKGVRQLLPKLPVNTVMHYTGISTGHRDTCAVPKDESTTCQKRQNISKQQRAVWQRPNISITPLPNLQNDSYGNASVKKNLQENSVSLLNKSRIFNICEICDSRLVDLGKLKTHLREVHQAKFSKKASHSSPSLGCQKCPLRFFTDQGLERHLLGTHGLVTTSIQEAARNEKDGGHCPICAKSFQKKMLEHMNKEHKMNLKPVNISYKCTLCTTVTFRKYQQFEDHVFAVHSGSNSKKNSITPSDNPSKDVLKSLKENNEITIISHSKSNRRNSSSHKHQESKRFERTNSNQPMDKHKDKMSNKNCLQSKKNIINISDKEEENINHCWIVNDETNENISEQQNLISEDNKSEKCTTANKKVLFANKIGSGSFNEEKTSSLCSKENTSDNVSDSEGHKNFSEDNDKNKCDKVSTFFKKGGNEHVIKCDSSVTIKEANDNSNELPINKNEHKRMDLHNELVVLSDSDDAETSYQKEKAESQLKIKRQSLIDKKGPVELVHLDDSYEKENMCPREMNSSSSDLEENIQNNVSESEKTENCLMKKNEEHCNIHIVNGNSLLEDHQINNETLNEESMDKNESEATVNYTNEDMKVLPLSTLKDTTCFKQSSTLKERKARRISRDLKTTHPEDDYVEELLPDDSVQEQMEEGECDVIDEQK